MRRFSRSLARQPASQFCSFGRWLAACSPAGSGLALSVSLISEILLRLAGRQAGRSFLPSFRSCMGRLSSSLKPCCQSNVTDVTRALSSLPRPLPLRETLAAPAYTHTHGQRVEEATGMEEANLEQENNLHIAAPQRTNENRPHRSECLDKKRPGQPIRWLTGCPRDRATGQPKDEQRKNKR